MERQGPRSFDPVRLGQRECAAWTAYYRTQWVRGMISSVGLVRAGFGMDWPRTLLGAWYMLRAIRAWAPYPDNDPDAARAYMRRFYALVAADGGLELNPAEAARREVEWWRVHRMHQRDDGLSEFDLVHALCDLYAHLYGVAAEDVAVAAHHRVVAMRLSDEWVAGGCASDDPRLVEEREELIKSYTALRVAVA
jgi:hypothetical protein